MSCGGMSLLAEHGGCGCVAGVNRHESYKGSEGTVTPSFNYTRQYKEQETPLPKTQTNRNYAIERVYVPTVKEGSLERVYAAPFLEVPVIASQSTIDAVAKEPKLRAPDAPTYDRRQSLDEITRLEDVYVKQRVLESKIAEAWQRTPLVMINERN